MRGEARMFLGEYQHTLDPKGRVSLPRRFRDATSGTVVIAMGFEKSLAVYTVEGYEGFLNEMVSGGEFKADLRHLRRIHAASAGEVEIDSAGRVCIPAKLRAFAGLKKDVIVAGVGDHMEIWDADAWTAYETEHAHTLEDAAEELARQGIL